MEVKESEWISKAIDNIDRYLNRGGDLKGDEPQLLGGTNLLNTIGVAMGLPVRDPTNWSESEMQRALNGELVFFEDDARKAIDVIAEQIRSCCNGDDKNFITVLPIELYWNGKLYELPLFRVQRYKDSKKYYVDNIGRSYDSVSDWFSNNKLPPCKMAYPYDLRLMVRPGYNYSRVLVDDTPSARTGTKVIKGVDIAASVAGITSSVGLLFVTGGLAAPLVATGVATAIYGTGRTAYQLTDKATHGESINPFTNSESRMLWLGIAANIVSFGAMGASMRLTSLAVRGRDISSSFRLLVNVMNGTNIVVSGIAIIDTTIFMIEHYDELSPVDLLMHAAAIAFWTKGVFTYKTAGTLIRNAHEQVFTVITKELNSDEAANLSNVRKQFNNDALLIREFHRASKGNISPVLFSQILIDANLNGQVQLDGAGNLVLTGGQTYSFEFLSKLPQNVRRHYFDVITNLRPEQIELMESFRQKVNNDMNLISGLHKVAVHYQLTPREATEQVLNFWARYTQMNMPTGTDITIKDNSLILGRAPPLQLPQLRGMSAPMLRFVGEHLVRMDENTSRQWTTSIPVLLQLEGNGMFSKCTITKIVPTGRAVVLLNQNLQISIFKLKEIDSTDCKEILKLVGQLSSSTTTSNIPKETEKLINKYRLRLEVHRRESVTWMTSNANERLLSILGSTLQNFERDRLFTFRSTVTTAKAMPYMKELMNFVADMNPKNVSEMVAYGEYVVTYVEAEKRALELKLKSGELKLPANTNKAEFLRKRASNAVFQNPRAMQQKWTDTVAIVRENSMVGPAALTSGLSDEALVQAIRKARIGFGSEASAAYHVLKHPTDPPSAYVTRANACVRNDSRWQVTLTQDGDARMIRFESPVGAAILLERDGRVLLCTFSPKTSRE
ncbi:uncharacterized protein [Epargyreus clarus]|uniref:uncharacterized protein n=1 Tax=Epargyreus clarus TaxID=520877 RepID=UPI003C2C4EA7